MLHWQQCNEIKLECRLDLDQLFNPAAEMGAARELFEARWDEFYQDNVNCDVYRRDNNIILYQSEQLIPKKRSATPSVLLVLGNPASHSVQNGMFFAYEGKDKDRDHRFWRILEPLADLLPKTIELQTFDNINQMRKQKILELDYDQPFKIGLCVMLTMPSAPGGKWGGVQGIQRLLGRKAYRKVLEAESKRVTKIARTFIKNGGAVIAFQKDAWETLRCERSTAYSIAKAKSNDLVGRLKVAPEIPLYGVAPTRLLGPCQKVIGKIATTLKKRAPHGDV